MCPYIVLDQALGFIIEKIAAICSCLVAHVCFRYVFLLFSFTEEKVLHLNPEQEKDKTHFIEKDVSFGVVVKGSQLDAFSP